MREILFRGKRVDNGEWVCGYLYRLSERLNPFIMLVNSNAESHEVILETVGQFTGLCDKNSTKIFEGDVVRFYDKDWTASGIATIDFENSKWKINGHYTTKLSSIVWLDLYRTGFEYEIIGNICDNPELSKEL